MYALTKIRINIEFMKTQTLLFGLDMVKWNRKKPLLVTRTSCKPLKTEAQKNSL